MVIPKKDLEQFRYANSGLTILRHKKARVQMTTLDSQPNKVYVQKIDIVGNAASQKEFTGVKGFWEATAEFEKQISEALNLREVGGFEVGMIVQLNQDTRKYRKGDILMVLAVDQDGNATQYERLNNRQIENVKNSPRMKKLVKIEGLEFLRMANINTLNDVDPKKKYNFQLTADTYTLIPTTYDFNGLEAGDKVTIKKSQGGGEATIEQLAFITDSDGLSELSAFVNFEDGSNGRLPIKYLNK
jgi:hypothetical protein